MELRKENPEKHYTFREEIGRGKYAVVKACTDKKTRKQLVAKLIKYDAETEKNAKQEFDIMKTIKHDKLLTARDGFVVRKYVVISWNGRIEGKEMLEFLGDKARANEEDASLVIAQLVETLSYLHRQNIVHLDIRKTLVLMKMLMRKLLQRSEQQRLKCRPACFHNATQEAENLIKKLLVRQPERRPTAATCLDDPWLSEEDELVDASCVLRSFDEDEYESPDEEEE
ncbi:hypothetical protein OS493_039016 [Desmophyllum pertusum]|uniref:Protein kinase domain-containing protein n=1 Tax=Desmophyllum pertusum TaxID=174260 RepID=A0A9W9Y6T7_9CNID|nr:hypothetical protein OS493_039016 [Desmophyllum pertusum]